MCQAYNAIYVHKKLFLIIFQACSNLLKYFTASFLPSVKKLVTQQTVMYILNTKSVWKIRN